MRVTGFRIGREQYAVLAFELAKPQSRPALDDLTRSEHEVAALCAQGLSSSEIARARAVSIRTVANQLAQIYRKLGLHSRRELAAFLRAKVGARS